MLRTAFLPGAYYIRWVLGSRRGCWKQSFSWQRELQ